MKLKQFLAAALCMCLTLTAGAVPVQAEDKIPGDINGDGQLDVEDAVLLKFWLRGIEFDGVGCADMNNDGVIDVIDMVLLKRAILQIDPDADFSAVSLSKNVKSNVVEGAQADDAFVLGQTEFALSLLQNTVEGGENIFLSPYSAVQALAMTANGADGVTRTEMEQVIGGMPMEQLNGYLYTQRSRQPYKEYCRLTTANSIWFRDTEALTVQPDFLQTNSDYYGADVFKAPFDESTARDINNWVNKNTRGMIPKLLDEKQPIPDTTMLYLMNAVAFDAMWEEPYEDIYQVGEQIFTAFGGTEQLAEMMYSTEHSYLEDDHATGFMKPYEGRSYAFAALLPEEGLSVTDYIAGLTAEELHETLSSPQKRKVYATLPKFGYDYEISLKEPLAAMGMPSAFGMGADFSRMGSYANAPLFINSVKQKTHINVFEEGTKAAALTSVEMAAGAAPDFEEPKEVVLDRPFVYCIVDMETALPVFIGVLMDIPE